MTDKPCPYRKDFDSAARTLAQVLPRILGAIGMTDKLDLVIVLRSQFCNCSVCVAPHPEAARAAARELESVAQLGEQPKAQPS